MKAKLKCADCSPPQSPMPSIWTKSVNHSEDFTRKLEVELCWINSSSAKLLTVPLQLGRIPMISLPFNLSLSSSYWYKELSTVQLWPSILDCNMTHVNLPAQCGDLREWCAPHILLSQNQLSGTDDAAKCGKRKCYDTSEPPSRHCRPNYILAWEWTLIWRALSQFGLACLQRN